MKTTELYRRFLAETGDPLPAALLVLADAALGQRQAESPTGEWLTIKQAAAEFSLSERALYRLTDLHHRNGRSVRIKRSELEAYLGEQESLFD